MKTIKKNLSVSLPYQFSISKSIHNCELLFFDIETTGFSPDVSSIYLIGCCYYQNNTWNLIQYFADDYISEKTMLESFLNFAKTYKVMIHFNGNGFDIPYIQKKLSYYNMNFSFDSFLQIDLYKKIFPYRKILGFSNLKQKTLENYLNLPRKDMYSGGDLIDVYVTYMKHKFSHSTELDKDLSKLLLHNEEDVTNLIGLTALLAYSDLFEEKPDSCSYQVNENNLSITVHLNNPLPAAFQYRTDGLSLFAENTDVQFTINCKQDELKYFYSNYKDYYYLPKEDMAIHKSVAEFVEKEYRTKAKASNCYTKKTGIFLPQFHGNLTPVFQTAYKGKEHFIELTDKFLSDSQILLEYVSVLLEHLLQINRK